MSVTLLAIEASYVRGDSAPDIEIFGRDKHGESYTVICQGFRPYCYMTADPDALRDLRQQLKTSILDVEDTVLEFVQELRDYYKITFAYPWCVRKARKLMKRHGVTFFSADILFELRFWYDNDLSSYIEVEGVEYEGASDYTTDHVIYATSVKPSKNNFRPRVSVLSFDIETSLDHKTLYCMTASVRRVDGSYREYKIVGDMVTMIRAFEDVIVNEDPDVITGYNINNFDLVVMEDVARSNKMSGLHIGRDKSTPWKREKGQFTFWDIKGRVVIDAWLEFKRTKRPRSETLSYAAKSLLGREKEDVDSSNMDKEWKVRPTEVIEYCQTDSELALLILEELKTLQSGFDMAFVSMLPFGKVVGGSNSRMMDSLVIRIADKEGYAVPMNTWGADSDYSERIEGAYVHEMKRGFFEWVVALDFKSLYPSLIIDKNICFTTFTPDGRGPIESPIGTHFVSKEERVGILPRIEASLMEQREQYKALMKEAEDHSWRNYYDRIQATVKILMNAMYGVFASSFYRFALYEIGGTITAYAREAIIAVVTALEEQGYGIIAGDTDSVFVHSPYHSLNRCLAFGRTLANWFSREGLILEFEYVINGFMSHGKKKRYMARVVWPVETKLVRGYETRRTDSFDALTRTMDVASDMFLDGDKRGALQYIRDVIERLKGLEMPIEDLVIYKSCHEDDYYKNADSQAQVRARRKLVAAGYEFTPGMKVGYIVTSAKESPQRVEPYIRGREVDSTGKRIGYDVDYYLERLTRSLARITSVFKISAKDLRTGTIQKQLDDFEGYDFGEWEEVESV